MDFCIYLDDFISNIPNFYCDDCPRCPDSGDGFDCPYHCFKEVKLTEEPDNEEITCEHGYYPYCPNCEHGLVIQEEWMQEDNCKWVCLLDNEN